MNLDDLIFFLLLLIVEQLAGADKCGGGFWRVYFRPREFSCVICNFSIYLFRGGWYSNIIFV